MVALSGAILGSKRGALSQVTLIGFGLLGLPVFSAPLPGQIVLLGPTGGYILGFVLCAFATGLLFERLELRNPLTRFAALFASSFFILVPGVLWLSVFVGDLKLAVMTGLIPFLVGDLIKCAMVTVATYSLRAKPPKTLADKR
jgi:biotin transport system substrate-specific component